VRALALVAIAAASAWVIAFRLGDDGPLRLAFDVYFYFYPNILHALRSLAAEGSGLLWNPFQNCGQPFFANIETGLVYPLHLLFLVLDPHRALRAVLFGNLVIGGVGSYGLGRELGASRVAALGGALAFVLGTSAYHVTLWMPTVQAPFVWLPAAMWCCERLIAAPGLRRALLLGWVLGLALLPGHPQFVLFLCQMVMLRLVWSCFDAAERRRLPRAAAGVIGAFLLMLLLGAVQYLPAQELVAESVRSGSLRPQEIAPQGNLTFTQLAGAIRMHIAQIPFAIEPAIVAATALAGGTRRRVAFFYAIAGVLFLLLSLGEATPIGHLYHQTPPGRLFREPLRLMLVTGFCVSVLIGLAIDGLARGGWRPLGLALAAALGLRLWVGSFSPSEWLLTGGILAAGLVGARKPAARPIARIAIVGALTLGPVLVPHLPGVRHAADDSPLREHALVFERLRARMTPQDRVHLARPHADPGFQDKSATLFAVPATTDYELQVTRRYAEYLVMLLQGKPLETVNQIYFTGLFPLAIQWPLVHLAAARYLAIAEGPAADFGPFRAAHLKRIDGDHSIGVYENPGALPRAYYVPQIAVEPDAGARLRRLAAGSEDRRRLALVGAVPGSGFLGVPGNQAIAEARFTADDPERVVLEVQTPERGFLFLADQFFPGWSAEVNGKPADILVGNHAFRLVEVPKGPARVEFRYSPARVWLGAGVSCASLIVSILMLVWSFRRREDRPGRGRSGEDGGP
jgi:hypothetical protein